MEEVKKFQNYHDSVVEFSFRARLPNTISHNLLVFSRKLYENGFYSINDKYLLGENLMIMNRSSGVDSNFFVFIKKKSQDELNIFFTNPTKDQEIPKEKLVFNYIIKNNEYTAKTLERIAQKALIISNLKPVDEYWGVFHSHIGTINGERVWDDGITNSRNWILQSMLWNHDYHALTSHNWTHNEERLNFMDEHCRAANLIFIPGWENTTTIADRVKSPHIIVLCKDISTAMKAKYEFLSKKIIKNDPKKDKVTPVLSGVPGPYPVHFQYLKSLHEKNEAAIFISHPSSSNHGIDILDQSIVDQIGESRVLDILFNFADGIEGFNLKELNSGFATGDMIKKFKLEMTIEGLDYPTTHMIINWYVGKLGERKKILILANQDDHFQTSIDSSILSDYSYGYNKLTFTKAALDYFRKKGRKPNAEEIVYCMINRNLKNFKEIPDEYSNKDLSFNMEPVVFVKINEKGISLIESRRHNIIDKVSLWLKSEPNYYLNIAKLQFKYWFADKEQKKEIRKEIEKAKAFKEKISD